MQLEVMEEDELATLEEERDVGELLDTEETELLLLILEEGSKELEPQLERLKELVVSETDETLEILFSSDAHEETELLSLTPDVYALLQLTLAALQTKQLDNLLLFSDHPQLLETTELEVSGADELLLLLPSTGELLPDDSLLQLTLPLDMEPGLDGLVLLSSDAQLLKTLADELQ